MPDRVKAPIVIGMRESLSTVVDDARGVCALCQQAIHYPSQIPDRAVLICLLCFIVHAEPGAMCALHAETIDDLLELDLAAMPVKGSPC